MLEADILEHPSGEMPVIGNVSMKGVTIVLDELTAHGAFAVTEGSGREDKCVVGKAYEVGGKIYYVKNMRVLTPDENTTGIVHLTSQAKLIDEAWDGSGRTRDFGSIKDKLLPIPEQEHPAIVSALVDAIFSGYEAARQRPRYKALLNCMIA